MIILQSNWVGFSLSCMHRSIRANAPSPVCIHEWGPLQYVAHLEGAAALELARRTVRERCGESSFWPGKFLRIFFRPLRTSPHVSAVLRSSCGHASTGTYAETKAGRGERKEALPRRRNGTGPRATLTSRDATSVCTKLTFPSRWPSKRSS